MITHSFDSRKEGLMATFNMFVSRRLRLFSSASGGNGNFSLQTAARELARTFGQKAQPPTGDQKTFFEFGPAFVQTINPFPFQSQLLEAEVRARAERDPEFLGEGQPWVPTKYVNQVIREAGTYRRPQHPNQKDIKPEVEPTLTENQKFWEKKRREGVIAASHRPAELVVTGKEIHFMNGFFLTRFISDGGKILPRRRTGLTSKQQRKLAHEVRKARQIGIIPIMQKFLPGFEATLDRQAIPNPFEGLLSIPRRENKESASPRDKEDTTKSLNTARSEIAAERAVPVKITFGVPEIDNLVSEEELTQFLRQFRMPVPQLYSTGRLRFRAIEAWLYGSAPEVVREFLAKSKAEMTDCTKDDHYLIRALQYVHVFEEHVFRDSKVYNSIRFRPQVMSLFQYTPPPTYIYADRGEGRSRGDDTRNQ